MRATTPMTLELLFARIVGLLAEAGVPFMVAGSFASAAHGLPRTTQDLDLVIDPADVDALDAFLRLLSPDDFYVDVATAHDALRRRSIFNVIDQRSGWKIDFIVRKDRPFSREELARRMSITMMGTPAFIATPEDTIIAKLEWSRLSGGSERQRRDVAGIVATMGESLDVGYVTRWVADLGLDEEWRTAQQTPLV